MSETTQQAERWRGMVISGGPYRRTEDGVVYATPSYLNALEARLQAAGQALTVAQQERDELRTALEKIVAEAEGCERLPQPDAYDYSGALEKTIQDLLLDHADIARAALTPSEPAP